MINQIKQTTNNLEQPINSLEQITTNIELTTNNIDPTTTKSKQKEYVGVTGFKTKEEIEIASNAFKIAGINKNSKITGMYGFLITDDQIFDFKEKGVLSPSLNALPNLIKTVPKGMMPTIHYCSRTRDLNLDKLMHLLYHVNTFSDCNFLQLNLDWPNPKKIETLKKIMPNMYIILQLDPEQQSINDAIKKIIINYEGLADKILIDSSHGAGIPYDSKTTSKMMMKIDADTSMFSYTICGGLTENNVYKRIIELKQIIKQEYPYMRSKIPFSVDAQGQLRTFDNSNLNYERVTNYICNAVKGLKDRI
ncbi:MAG: hypothetical protein WC758_04200 [Candidatus Woesearchaeota archaeon]|jgi:hypothetical protein